MESKTKNTSRNTGGTTFRLRGKGAPSLRTNQMEINMYKLKLKFLKVTDEQAEHLRAFAKESGYGETKEQRVNPFSQR